MTRLARAGDLVGRPVVSIADGEDVAEVKDVVFEPERHALMGFTLNQRGFWHGRLRALLPSVNVAAIGPDAVMIASSDCLTEPDEAPAVLQPSGHRHGVVGATATTIGGRSLGTVRDVVVSLGPRLEVVGYELDVPGGRHPLVPVDAQIALSAETLLLPDEVEPYIREDLASFADAVAAFRGRPPAGAGSDAGLIPGPSPVAAPNEGAR